MSASASYSPLVSKLYTSRNVILEIMAHRGFATEEWTGSSINEVHLMYAHKTQDMLLENPTTGRKVYIQYHTGGRLAARHIYELIDDLYVEEETLSDEDETIIVTKDKMNDTQKRLLTQVYNQYGKFLNIFWLDDYLTRHAGRFPSCHMKDIDADGDFEDVGHGQIDFPTFTRMAVAQGARHFFVERDNPPDPSASIVRSYEYLSQMTY